MGPARLFFLTAMAVCLMPACALAQTEYIYNQCPDCADRCYEFGCMGWECSQEGIPVCNGDELSVSKNAYTLFRWDDAPFDGSVIDGYLVNVNSAKISLTGEHTSFLSNPDTDLEVEIFDCNSAQYVHEYTFDFDNKETTFTKTVTSYFERCEQDFRIRVRVSDEELYNVLLYEVLLEVRYTIEPLGMDAYMSTSGLPGTGEIAKTESFNAHADIECQGSSCGHVSAELQYREQGSTTFSAVGDSGGLVTFQDNPYSCGTVGSGDPCSYTWPVYGKEEGSYEFRVKAASDLDGIDDEFSAQRSVSVLLGDVSLRDVYFEPYTLDEPFLETTLHAKVTCSDYYCGPVRLFAKNGSSKITDDQYFSIVGDNPKTVTPSPGSPRSVTWQITPKATGLHKGIYVAADPEENGIGYSTLEPEQDLIVLVPDPESGYLSVSSPSLSPDSIQEGEYSTLSGIVECIGGPCGIVQASAMQGGSQISALSGDLTVEQNPVSCSDMSGGQTCPVSWQVRGNNDGTYSGIGILAESSDPEVEPYDSTGMSLDVQEPPGVLQVTSVGLSPDAINVSEPASFTCTVSCSNDNCGDVSAYLREEGGEAIGETGGVTTSGSNPKTCFSPPCQLTWNLEGKEAGIYDLIIEARSTVSPAVWSTKETLQVSDPELPEQPLIHASAIPDSEAFSGEPLMVESEISCYDAYCGEVSAYIEQYVDGGWEALGAGTPVACGANERSFTLEAGGSRTESWEMTPSEEGHHELRMRAGSSLAQGPDKYFSIDARDEEESLVSVDILSPESGGTYWLGDEVSIEIYVTENFYPVEGLGPVAEFSGSVAETLYLAGDGGGRYSGSLVIDQASAGRSDFTITASEASGEGHIQINPSLDVSFSIEDSSLNVTEKLVASGSISRGNQPSQADLSVDFICSGWRSSVSSVDVTEEGDFEMTYWLPRDTPAGDCEALAMAVDSDGNSGNASSGFRVFRTEQDKEKSIYNISFISPRDGSVFSTYEEFLIELSVTKDGSPLEGADVRCADPNGNFNILLNETLHTYEAWVEARMPPAGESWNLRCEAETVDGFYGSSYMDISVRPVLVIDVIEPEGKTFEKGEMVDFKVQVFSNGMPLEQGSVYMTVNGDVINLNYSRNGIFEKEYVFATEGEYDFEIIAHDSHGNIESIPVSVSTFDPVRINWLAIALSGSGSVILGLLWLFHRTRKGKTVVRTVTRTVTKTVVKKPDRKTMLREKLRDLEKERDAIEDAKEKCEMEYYQRKLTENEFKKMMENYEQELLKIEAEIREFSGELGDD